METNIRRQLATDILYALDAVGVLVSEVYKLEATLSGSLGHYRALTGRKKTECPELWENCGNLWEDF